MRTINGHLRASKSLVLLARYEVLSRFQVLPWRQRAEAVRMLIESLDSVPSAMERAALRSAARNQRGTAHA
jgi:hypothetical protein